VNTATKTESDHVPTAASPVAAGPPTPRLSRDRVVELAEAGALLAITVALIIAFSLLPSTTETFPTSGNLQVILGDQAILLVVALACFAPLVTGVWDFSPGATMGISAIFSASVAAETGSIPLAILAAAGTGLVIGTANGLLVTRARIHSVIATLGMTILIAGVVQWKTDGKSIVGGIPEGVSDFGSAKPLGIPSVACVAIVLALVVYYLLRHTPYGRYLYAIGSSRGAARLVGVRVELLTMSTFVLGGLLAGLGGLLLVARTGAGNPTVGPGFTLPAYAALFLGLAAIKPGRWNVGGLLVAVIFLGALNSGLNLSGASSYVSDLANGFALMVGVGVSTFLARKRGRPVEIQ
jgi:ribose transport system permease protein